MPDGRPPGACRRYAGGHSIPETRAYLGAIGLFALGRIPETFLLLRDHGLGMTVVELLLAWAATHAIKVLTAEGADTEQAVC